MNILTNSDYKDLQKKLLDDLDEVRPITKKIIQSIVGSDCRYIPRIRAMYNSGAYLRSIKIMIILNHIKTDDLSLEYEPGKIQVIPRNSSFESIKSFVVDGKLTD